MKKQKFGIFPKTFCMSLVILILITALAYLLIYILLPHFYQTYKTQQYQALSETLILELQQADNTAEENTIVSDFALKNNVSATLKENNENGKTLVSFSASTISVLEQEIEDQEMLSDEIWQSEEFGEESDSIVMDFSFDTTAGARYLTLSIPLQPLNEARDVIINIYPIAVFICIVFSLLFSFLQSSFFVRPIREIRRVTGEMRTLKPEARISVSSSDEMGELAGDVNELYQELLGTIHALSHELDKFSESENKKLDFLRTLSHELKTPIASTIALMEALIYDIPPYSENPQKYLSESRQLLEKAAALIKESLQMTNNDYKETPVPCNIKNIVEETFRSYRMVVRLKQISYEETLPDDIVVNTKGHIFSKVISNLISNAVNYTPEAGDIKIYYRENERAIRIENTCHPLSDEELSKIFAPFYSGNEKNLLSNGLGLYIVSQLLQLLKMRFSFCRSQDRTGMCFTIYLEDLS